MSGNTDLLKALQKLRRDTSASWAWVSLIEGDEAVTLAGDGAGHDRLTGRRIPLADTVISRLDAAHQDLLIIDDTFESYTDWTIRTRVIRIGLGACAIALIRDDDKRLIAAVTVGRPSGAPHFDDADAATVQAAAEVLRPLLQAEAARRQRL